jgi:hypothetical protein
MNFVILRSADGVPPAPSLLISFSRAMSYDPSMDTLYLSVLNYVIISLVIKTQQMQCKIYSKFCFRVDTGRTSAGATS